MEKKLTTKLTFEFDTEQLEESFPQVVCDVDMETNSEKTNITIVEVSKKKTNRRKYDASTRLF